MDRLEKLRELIESFGGPSALAKRLGYTNASYLVQMAGPNPLRPITEKTARKIESALALPAHWLDSIDRVPKIGPVKGTAVGSSDLQAILDAGAKHGVTLNARTLVGVAALIERFSRPEDRADLIEAVIALLAFRLNETSGVTIVQ